MFQNCIKVSNSQESPVTPKLKPVLITGVALIALAAIAIGTLTLLSSSHSFAHIFTKVPPYGAGILLGSGGTFLSGATIYSLYALLARCHLPVKKKNPPLPPEEVPKEIENVEIEKEAEVPKNRSLISLPYAMRLFKNYDEQLAKKYATPLSLGSFLEECSKAFPAREAQEKLNQLILIQKALESETDDLQTVKVVYESWLSSVSTTPFCFFGLADGKEGKQIVLIQITKEMNISSESLLIGMQCLQQYLTKGTPLPQHDLFKIDEKIPLSRPLHTLLKTTEKEGWTACKKIYLFNLLKKTLHDYPEWTQDAHFRAWVGSSILYLEKSVSNIAAPESLQKEWQETLQGLSISKHSYLNLPKLEPASITKPIGFSPFQIKEVNLTPLVPYPGEKVASKPLIKTTEIKSLRAPDSYPTFTNKQDLLLLQQWHEYFFTFYKQEERTEALEAQVNQFLLHMPEGKEMSSLLGSLSDEEKETLVKMLQEIGTLALTAHVTLGRIVLHPSRLLASLKNLEVMITIIQSIPGNYFADLTVATGVFFHVLKDAYYDLGAYQFRLCNILDVIDKKAEIGANNQPKSLKFFDFHSSKDYGGEWLARLICKNPIAPRGFSIPQDQMKKANADYSGTFIPQSIAQLRTFYLMTVGFACPHKYLFYNENPYEKREDFKKHMQGLQKALQPGMQTLKKTKELLKIEEGELVHFKIPILFPEHFQRAVRAYERLGAPMSPFFSLGGPIINHEIRLRLVEGMIANTTSSIADQDGNYGGVVKKDFREKNSDDHMNGLRQTPFKINQDKFHFPNLSIEVSRDLQFMASGRDNRASSAIHTFCHHPHLLFHEKYGEDFKHILRLFLFRDDLLLREHYINPNAIPLLFKNLDGLLLFYERLNDFKTWTFLYQVQADILANFKGLAPELEVINSHKIHTAKLTKWIEAVEGGHSTELLEFRGHLHTAFLYCKSILGFDQNDLLQLGKIYFIAKNHIESALIKHPLEGQTLFDLSARLNQKLIDFVEEKGTGIIDDLISYRVKSSTGKREWQKLSPGVYQTGGFLLNLNEMQIVQEGKREGILPLEIREDDSLKALFGSELLEQLYTFTYITTAIGKAWFVSLDKGEQTFHLYLRDNDTRFPLLYRQNKNGEWEQLIRIVNSSSPLPVDLKNGYLWKTSEGLVSENPQGKKLYQPTFEENHLVDLKRYVNGHTEQVISIEENALFCRLDNEEGFIVTLKKPTEPPSVSYLRSKNGYDWNALEQKWESRLYKGYYLSNKTVEGWMAPGAHHQGSSFFVSFFTGYHIVENREGKGKLLIPYRTYGRNPPSRVASQEIKNSIPFSSEIEKTSPWQANTFASFDLEKNNYPKSTKPQDDFYLAYTLYTQGKYGEALLYLQRSQAVWAATDENECAQRSEIKRWFLKWNDNTPNGVAFKVHLLLMEHQLREATFASEQAILSLDAEVLPSLMEHANSYLKNIASTDPLLRFSEQAIEELHYLAPRAFSWVRNNMNSSLVDQEVRNYYSSAKENEAILQWSLDRRIAAFKPIPIKPIAKVPEDFISKPLFDVSEWLSPLSENEKQRQTKVRAEVLTKELQEVFIGQSLADSIGNELATDIEKHAQKVEASFTIREQASLDALLNDVIIPQERQLLKKEKQARTHILHQFIPPSLSTSEVQERQIKEQEAYFDHLLEQARYCFGIEDFSSLVSMGVISKEQVPSLQESIRLYEIHRTDRKLISRKKEGIQKLQNDPQNAVLREESASILQEWRQYDTEAHPYAGILLLLEDELNITVRHSQITHIHKLMANPDAYIHEAMAGGKTTLLRNLFSAIQSRAGYLAGVVTYSPLMAMHHKEYATVNNLSLGSAAYPLYYSRNASHDATAIKMMIIYHLKALSQNGRIDQTPQAVISLNHTLTELVLSLEKGDQETLKDLKPSINALQQLLALRGNTLSVYSDEIDKIFDPLKDFNYSVGKASVLQPEFYNPALTLTQFLMENSSFKELKQAIQTNRLPQMSDADFEKHLRALAKEALTHYGIVLDETKALDYLTEVYQNDIPKQQAVINFYKEKILTLENKEHVRTLQILHSYIGVLLRNMKNKQVGTDFGRSEDGISVKPFAFSAVCQESSQRSFVLSTVLEICLDYLASGIGVEGAKAYVACIQEAAVKELDSVKNESVTIDATPSGQLFYQRFSIQLSQVRNGSYNKIASILDSKYSLFEECLCEILLKKFTFYTKKISGNAHHLPHLIGHFSGSSGSPERVKTLPASIKKPAKLIRQEGAIGSVFYALLKEFESVDLIPFSPDQSTEQQIANYLQPGDTFIDNAPYFSGKKGIEIVQALAAKGPQVPYRFLDEENDVCIWEHEHVRKGEAGINLSEVISVIPHKGRQGTNWKFASGKKGIVECGVTTDLTSFYQSLMRLRLLGKGQKALILYDKTLERVWNNIPELQGKSTLCKILWTLVRNEDPLLKRFNYQANRKEILAIRTSAIDLIKRKVTDLEKLIEIKDLESYQLIENTPLDPTKFGQPIELEQSPRALQTFASSEKTQLQKLRSEISALSIDKKVIQECQEILDAHLQAFDSPNLIMDKRDLPDYSATNHNDSDALEEIEVEDHQEVEAQAAVQQVVSLEVEMELELTVEDQIQSEEDVCKSQDHPYTLEGRESTQYAIAGASWMERMEGLNIVHHNYGTGPVDEKLFPHIWASNHALCLYNGVIKGPKPELARIKPLWLFGDSEEESAFSSHVFVWIAADNVFCHMGSPKDSDLHYYDTIINAKIAEEWIYVDFATAKKMDPSALCSEQRRHLEAGQNYYDSNTKFYQKFKDKKYFKIDLRSTHIPESVPEHLKGEWIKRLALAKLLYVNARFSDAEKTYIKSWLETCGIPLDLLQKRLETHLSKYYPSTSRCELLELIKSKKGK